MGWVEGRVRGGKVIGGQGDITVLRLWEGCIVRNVRYLQLESQSTSSWECVATTSISTDTTHEINSCFQNPSIYEAFA